MTTCTTSWPICRRFADGLVCGLTGFALVLACSRLVIAQELDPAALLKPPADSWPTYHGDYSGQRHSRLTQITPDNVRQLTLELQVQRRGAVQQARAGEAGAVSLEGVAGTLHDTLVAGESQVVVRGEHDPRMPFHLHHRHRGRLDGTEVGHQVGLARGAQQLFALVAADFGEDVDRGGHIG